MQVPGMGQGVPSAQGSQKMRGPAGAIKAAALLAGAPLMPFVFPLFGLLGMLGSSMQNMMNSAGQTPYGGMKSPFADSTTMPLAQRDITPWDQSGGGVASKLKEIGSQLLGAQA
ncbi:MAG: hypothetical protein KDK48_00985 [Chlamydiia bacterium]|nr:hypothetical protein [Chlamydiia bacterium]